MAGCCGVENPDGGTRSLRNEYGVPGLGHGFGQLIEWNVSKNDYKHVVYLVVEKKSIEKLEIPWAKRRIHKGWDIHGEVTDEEYAAPDRPQDSVRGELVEDGYTGVAITTTCRKKCCPAELESVKE